MFTPFPRLPYDEAMERYGLDKPDLRFGLELFDVSAAMQGTEFLPFQAAQREGHRARRLRRLHPQADRRPDRSSPRRPARRA